MDKRLFPIDKETFKHNVEPLIHREYRREGRPPELPHWLVFCAIFYVMRTGIAWRDLPSCYGPWHTVYTRFKRWSESGLFWRVLYELQQNKKLRMEIVWVDSTSHKVHRHGAGAPKKRDSESG